MATNNELETRLNRLGKAVAAAPTTGTWKKGDRLLNNNPTAGGKIGWVCITAGTPGVWKAYGAIDA